MNKSIISVAQESKSWPFEEARKILKRLEKSGSNSAVFETGYGASGLPHIGTFGEVARTSMVKDAEANKEADKKKRESVDARNQADSLIFSTEKSLKEHGDKISAEEKKAIENGIADLKKSLEGTDSEDIKKKTQNLIQVSMKLGEAVYKSQQKPEAKEKESKAFYKQYQSPLYQVILTITLIVQ